MFIPDRPVKIEARNLTKPLGILDADASNCTVGKDEFPAKAVGMIEGLATPCPRNRLLHSPLRRKEDMPTQTSTVVLRD